MDPTEDGFENIIDFGKRTNNEKVIDFCEAIVEKNRKTDLKLGTIECLWFYRIYRNIEQDDMGFTTAVQKYLTTLRVYETLFPGKPNPKDIDDSEISKMLQEKRYEKLITKKRILSKTLQTYIAKIVDLFAYLKSKDKIKYNLFLYHEGFAILMKRLDNHNTYREGI